jgi:hypothetical protein
VMKISKVKIILPCRPIARRFFDNLSRAKYQLEFRIKMEIDSPPNNSPFQNAVAVTNPNVVITHPITRALPIPPSFPNIFSFIFDTKHRSTTGTGIADPLLDAGLEDERDGPLLPNGYGDSG